MSEAASLRISQKKIIKSFLNLHFGHKIAESSKKLAKFNSVYMPCTEYSFIIADGRVVKTWCRSLKSMLEFYFRRTEDEDWVGIKKIEVFVGGDNGKGSYLFIAVVLFRHADDGKEPHLLEVKLGEINESKDKMDFLTLLLRRIPYGLSSMSVNNSGDCCVSLNEMNNIKFASDEPEG